MIVTLDMLVVQCEVSNFKDLQWHCVILNAEFWKVTNFVNSAND